MPPARYAAFNTAFLASVLAGFAFLAGWAWLRELRPYTGDLTRVGAYREADYDATTPARAFPTSAANVRDAYDAPTDVVVFGDSFSRMRRTGWQDHVAARAQVTFTTLDHARLAATLGSAAFRDCPPRVVVFEIVERSLGRLRLDAGAPPPARAIARPSPLAWRAVPSEPQAEPAPAAGLLARLDPALPLADFRLEIPRRLIGRERTMAREVALTNATMFSSRRAGHLLYYEDDLKKAAWSADGLRAARDAIAAAARAAEANGSTTFFLMIAPDKTSVYREFLADPAVRMPDWLPAFAADPRFRSIDLHGPLVAAVRGGARDVYRPNDSHWSIEGAGVAARAFLRALEAAGALAPAAPRPAEKKG